jgi:N6-adenosine-specific RNA methylase IME4
MTKYKIIYADPPWHYNFSKSNKRSPNNKYKTMDLEDIKSLPINDIADKDCILFMWATYPKLLDALEVIKAWSFIYKTVGFVWVKQNKKNNSLFTGLGYYTRANSEICLIATKGHPKRISKSVHQIVQSRIREHSRKPDEVRDKIIQLCGDLPLIELFARQDINGWDTFGNEIIFNDDDKNNDLKLF